MLEEARNDGTKALVDRYMRLEEEISKLEEEKDMVKRAIIEKSRKSDINTISGNSHRIRVWPYRQCSFP